METATIIVFIATVLPLICTPGPDMLLVASQALSGGVQAGVRSTAGVCLGYVVHSALVTLGVAALITTVPIAFEVLRWLGFAYLVYLASRLIASAMRARDRSVSAMPSKGQLRRGFMTAVLNPKGMMIYVAILPQFLEAGDSFGRHALILSAIFIGLCGIVYVGLSIAIARLGRGSRFSDSQRRWVEATAGALLLIAAARLAAN